MSVWDDRAKSVQARLDDLLSDGPGVTWIIRETGVSFQALEKPLAVNDMPDLRAEGEDNSGNELGPLQLRAISRSVPLKINDELYREAQAATKDADNYIVRNVDPEYLGGTLVRQFAIVSRAPLPG